MRETEPTFDFLNFAREDICGPFLFLSRLIRLRGDGEDEQAYEVRVRVRVRF